MDKEEANLFKLLRNQILSIAVVTCLGGLGINTLFMFTINNTVNRVEKTQDKQQIKIDELTELVYKNIQNVKAP